jgi:hypothetical protein
MPSLVWTVSAIVLTAAVGMFVLHRSTGSLTAQWITAAAPCTCPPASDIDCKQVILPLLNKRCPPIMLFHASSWAAMMGLRNPCEASIIRAPDLTPAPPATAHVHGRLAAAAAALLDESSYPGWGGTLQSVTCVVEQ